MNLSLVTVGVLNYNNAKYAIQTLESIKNQSYHNIELLIVDDKSTDNSLAKIEIWLKSYNKPFKVILHERNLGVCATCNDVLKNANGKYISFIATDDIMLPHKIASQVEILELSESNVCSVYSDAYIMDEEGRSIPGKFIERYRNFDSMPDGDIYELLLPGNFLPAMSLMTKKICYDDIGFFDEELAYEDYDMWLRLSRKYKFIFSSYIGIMYRIRKDSLSQLILNWESENLKIYAKHMNNFSISNRFEDAALVAYCSNDAQTLYKLTPLKKFNSFINIVILLKKIKIHKRLGLMIISRLKRKNVLSTTMFKTD